MVIASCSGEGGAALSRRNYGETIAHLTAPRAIPTSSPRTTRSSREHVDQFPVDAHMLVALIAPRPVLLQTGNKDNWSDPKGEFLAAVAAGPVYRLFGKQGSDTEVPAAGSRFSTPSATRCTPAGTARSPRIGTSFLSSCRCTCSTSAEFALRPPIRAATSNQSCDLQSEPRPSGSGFPPRAPRPQPLSTACREAAAAPG